MPLHSFGEAALRKKESAKKENLKKSESLDPNTTSG